MKITCVKGSPRVNGNSSRLADYFLKNFENPENEIEIFNLNQLDYNGCQGCQMCHTDSERCVVDDDLQKVLESVRKSDMLVLASGVYYRDTTSQVKGFIDRTYSYYVPDFVTNPNPSRLEPGKRFVMILAQGHPDEDVFEDIFPKYTSFFVESHAFKESHLIRACGVLNDGDINGRKDVLKKADDIAEEILKGQ